MTGATGATGDRGPQGDRGPSGIKTIEHAFLEVPFQNITNRTATIKLYNGDTVELDSGHYFITLSLRTDIVSIVSGEFHFVITLPDGTLINVPKVPPVQRMRALYVIQAIVCLDTNKCKLIIINQNSVDYVIENGELLIIRLPY